jgi:DNA-binding transcriptional regulator YdaS (Cro superfamily)
MVSTLNTRLLHFETNDLKNCEMNVTEGSSTSSLSTHDYRDYLRTHYETLREEHPLFSQAAFARRIGISKSYLKHVFMKRRHLKPERALMIADSLGWAPPEVRDFVLRVLQESAETTQLRSLISDLRAPNETH